ncbi:hypothetical protein ES705_39628 [subsurface metagenome]
MQVDAEVEGGYGPEEAAETLGKGIATIWRWLRDDKIAAVRVGGRVLIPRKEIDRLKKQNLPARKRVGLSE